MKDKIRNAMLLVITYFSIFFIFTSCYDFHNYCLKRKYLHFSVIKQLIDNFKNNDTERKYTTLKTRQYTKPDAEKIKHDLIGRKISDQPNGYHRQGWYWKIEEGEIKEFQILNESKQGNDYLFEIRLVLQADGSAQEMFINLTYILGNNNEWTIEFIESKQVNVVKTGKYDNCVTIQRKGWSGEYYLELINHCDVALVVGGEILPEFNGQWQKFSAVVNANEKSEVGGLFSVSIIDYKIHFIERP